MQLQGIPFQTIDWAAVGPTTHAGTTGTAVWRTVEVGNVRVRLVEYSPGYVADGDGAHRSRSSVGARLFIVD